MNGYVAPSPAPASRTRRSATISGSIRRPSSGGLVKSGSRIAPIDCASRPCSARTTYSSGHQRNPTRGTVRRARPSSSRYTRTAAPSAGTRGPTTSPPAPNPSTCWRMPLASCTTPFQTSPKLSPNEPEPAYAFACSSETLARKRSPAAAPKRESASYSLHDAG